MNRFKAETGSRRAFLESIPTMGEQEDTKQIQEAFLKSRDGAIVRCASIMISSGRKDLAMQILQTTRIDRNRFNELKAQNT